MFAEGPHSEKVRETDPPHGPGNLSRRDLMLGGGAAAATFAVVPRHVLGGAGYVAPSEKITLACIGFGTQAIRELGGILASPEVRVVAVCDVDRDGVGLLEWGKGQVRETVRRLIGNPTWRAGDDRVPGGREVGKEIVEAYYARQSGRERDKGCATYADFRELLDRERDLTAVKVMTPDHTHAAISLAALRKGLNVIVHKPLANRLLEARAIVETARQKKLATHFLPASEGAGQARALEMVHNGAIGTLREIHNWSMRPMWPQYPTLPADRPPVPSGFDWTLWLGPSTDRPYHPSYTHTNFRGWYEFGGGPIADMGHYSLWPIFQLLELGPPISVESTPSHVCETSGTTCRRIHNDYSFPAACTVRMRFGPRAGRGPIDLFWYDGGIKPPVPDELMAEGGELDEEGMLFVGSTGKVLGGFRAEKPRLLPESRMRAYRATHNTPEPEKDQRGGDPSTRTASWIAAFKGGPRSYGDFTLAGPISDAFTLASVSLRLGGRRLLFDAEAGKITNLPEANQYLTREYRPGWEV